MKFGFDFLTVPVPAYAILVEFGAFAGQLVALPCDFGGFFLGGRFFEASQLGHHGIDAAFDVRRNFRRFFGDLKWHEARVQVRAVRHLHDDLRRASRDAVAVANERRRRSAEWLVVEQNGGVRREFADSQAIVGLRELTDDRRHVRPAETQIATGRAADQKLIRCHRIRHDATRPETNLQVRRIGIDGSLTARYRYRGEHNRGPRSLRVENCGIGTQSENDDKPKFETRLRNLAESAVWHQRLQLCTHLPYTCPSTARSDFLPGRSRCYSNSRR